MALYTCPDCGCEEVIIKQVNKRTGVYCKDCYRWLAWVQTKDINKLRRRAKYNETQAPRKFIKFKGNTIIKCGNCGTQLYHSAMPEPEGQFNLMNAVYCPKCGKELV